MRCPQRAAQLTTTKKKKVTSFLSGSYFCSLKRKRSQDCGNHRFHLLERLCLTLSNVICGFRGYLHGKEACIVNLPVGRISCPCSYLICMPLLEQQQHLNYQLILFFFFFFCQTRWLKLSAWTSGLSALIST